MREIRFRGIDIKTRKFVYGSLVNFSELNDCPQYEIYSIEKITKQQKWYKVYDVGQYTGLNDKNGVEIYEGDIVKGGRGNHLPVVVKYGKYKDCFGDKFYGLYLDGYSANDSSKPMQFKIYNDLVLEVIGNIHESEVE